MKIERIISCFDKQTEKLKEEYNIDHVDIEELKGIFHPSDDDPLMYNPYTIGQKEASMLKKFISIEFDLQHFFYQVDCFQV